MSLKNELRFGLFSWQLLSILGVYDYLVKLEEHLTVCMDDVDFDPNAVL